MQPTGHRPDDPDAETRLVGPSDAATQIVPGASDAPTQLAGSVPPGGAPYSPAPGAPQVDADAATQLVGGGSTAGGYQPPSGYQQPAGYQQPGGYPPTTPYPAGYQQSSGQPTGGYYGQQPGTPAPAGYQQPASPPPGYSAGQQGYYGGTTPGATPAGYGQQAGYGYQAGQPGYDPGQAQQAGYQQGGYPGYQQPSPGYGQPPYGGAPGYPGGPGQPNNRRRNVLIGAIAGVVVLVLVVVLLVVLLGGDDEEDPVTRPTPTTAPTATVSVPPTTAPPTTPPSSPSPTAGAFSIAEQDLLDRIDPNVLTDCAADPDWEDSEVEAALRCYAVEDGREIIALGYFDQAALERDLDLRHEGVPTDGDCSIGEESRGTWTQTTPDGTETQPGTLVCKYDEAGDFLIHYTYDADLAGFLMADSDPAAVYEFWTSFHPLGLD